MIKHFFGLLMLFNGVLAVAQGSGNTLRFDGSSTRIIHDPLFNTEQLPITLSYWMKINGDLRAAERIFNSCYTSDNFYYGISSHLIRERVSSSYGDGRGALHPAFRQSKSFGFRSNISDRWIHVAISIRGSRDMSIYIDGVDVGGEYSGSGLSMAVNSACKTIIGYGTDNNGAQFLRGELDEIRVWKYSRSIDQIRSDMTKKLVGNESGLVGYWNFEEGTGTDTEELISGNKGSIEGNVNWVLSGAPIGDESYFEYFSAGTKKKLFKNHSDSFWISTESDNWIGYHVYKVNEAPNSDLGSTIDLSDGYYGVFPVFENEESEEYRIDFGDFGCTVGNVREGNSDEVWDEVITTSDSSTYFLSNNIIELSYDVSGSIESIESEFIICAGESVQINALSDCVTEYNWFNVSSNPDIEIFEAGEYWLERTTPTGVIREEFRVVVETNKADFLAKDFYFICENEFPISILSTLDQELHWSTGEVATFISVDSRGIYWAEYASNCGIIRDSVFIEVIEVETDFFVEDTTFVCMNEFPILLSSTLDDDLTWSTGEVAVSINMDSVGIYWAEYSSECGLERDSIVLSLLEPEINFLQDSYQVCENEFPLLLTSTLSEDLTWSTGEVSSFISVEETGIYWAEYLSECGLIRDYVNVQNSKLESEFLMEDSYTLCKSDLPFLLESRLGSRILSWNTGEVDSLIAINSSGVYWAEYLSSCGVVRDSVLIEIEELNDVFIPNVLTPNGDKINDCFIIDDELSSSELLVFNRAGIEIFRSDHYQNNWCPEDIPSGVYFYQINNTCYQDSFQGWVSILK